MWQHLIYEDVRHPDEICLAGVKVEFLSTWYKKRLPATWGWGWGSGQLSPRSPRAPVMAWCEGPRRDIFWPDQRNQCDGRIWWFISFVEHFFCETVTTLHIVLEYKILRAVHFSIDENIVSLPACFDCLTGRMYIEFKRTSDGTDSKCFYKSVLVTS